MVKCSKCGKEVDFKTAWKLMRQGYTTCISCTEEIQKEEQKEERKKLEEIIANAPKIQCPFCKQWFPKLTNEQYRESAELNVLKWAIVPAWGVVGALKNKPYIECPHCKMKIMQG